MHDDNEVKNIIKTNMNNSAKKFLVVAAGKSATTALFYYLIQHPDVFVPPSKEPHYFSNLGNRMLNPFTRELVKEKITHSWEEYQSLFAGSAGKIQGDCSTSYFYYYRDSINNITAALGSEVKIIILLRDPVERAYSAYWHLRREEFTNISFDDYLRVEEGFSESETWGAFLVKNAGIYSPQLAAYLKAFPSVKIVFFDDFVVDPIAVSSEILDFIGATGTVDLKRPTYTNKTGSSRFAWLSSLIKNDWRGKKWIRKLAELAIGKAKFDDVVNTVLEKNYVKPITMSTEARNYLEDYYFHDVLKLERILGKEVSWQWVKEKKLLVQHSSI